jgi:hypothetical protein
MLWLLGRQDEGCNRDSFSVTSVANTPLMARVAARAWQSWGMGKREWDHTHPLQDKPVTRVLQHMHGGAPIISFVLLYKSGTNREAWPSAGHSTSPRLFFIPLACRRHRHTRTVVVFFRSPGTQCRPSARPAVSTNK